MQTTPAPRSSIALRDNVFQSLAILICVLLGLAMIANTQWGGEAMWFWYATTFHTGVKLYADLHTPLQPLFVLLTDGWMQMFGRKCLVTEIPSLLQVLLMCVGLYLVLRESDWPDWQKSIVLGSGFVLTVVGTSYRFDDYHVVAENLILYSLLLLLWIARDGSPRRKLWLAAALGILAGLTITSRVTDGVALLVASGLCLLVVARTRRLALLSLYVVAVALTVFLVVKLTGDTFPDYISSTIIRAAGSKGGTGSIFAAPLLFIGNVFAALRVTGKRILSWVLMLVLAGAVAQRYWKLGLRKIILLQLGITAITFVLVGRAERGQLLTGEYPAALTLLLPLLLYLLGLVVLVRFVNAVTRPEFSGWNAREILLLLPLAEWASYSAGAAAEAHTGYYAPLAMLLLLAVVLQPFRRVVWARAGFLTALLLLAFTGITFKIHNPYSWQNYTSRPMFTNRQWFNHPVFGPLYIDRDLLRFSVQVCTDMGETQIAQGKLGPFRPQLLSLPYPYPNYFCATPPWNGYVQTFFDTSTRSVIDHLMNQLETAPPQWIIYQRQLNIMVGSERLYNHGKPIAQRDLDKMIAAKIATGQWRLVDTSHYSEVENGEGQGWFIIETHP